MMMDSIRLARFLSRYLGLDVSPDVVAFALQFSGLILIALIATRIVIFGLRKWQSKAPELNAQLTVIMTYCLCWMYMASLTGVASLEKHVGDSLMFLLALGICAVIDERRLMRQERKASWLKFQENKKRVFETG